MTLTMTRLKPLLLIALAIEALTIAASGSQRLADSLCGSKKDGHYALGICSPDYLTCSNGTSFAHHCKFGLFFDKAREQCSDRKVIADCQAPFDCLDRDDGIYSDGCSQKFWYCFGGSAASSSCQPGLYFNAETKTCEYFKSIKACKGKCNQKTPVGDTCSDHYFVCIDQIPTRQTCKKHEAYDDYYRKCRDLNELPQCILNQIHRELNTIIENNEVQQPLDTLGNYVPVPYPGTFQGDRFHATYPTYTPPTATSVYAVEGSGEEISIDFNGIQRMSRFSSDNSDQMIATIMRNSGGSLHANVDIPGNLIRVGDLPDNKSSYVGSVESLVPTFCLDRRDGNFFVSCGTKFINCINHASTVKTCPDDLVFSEDINACVFINDVPLCANSILKANDSVKPVEVKEQKFSTERLVSNIKSGRALDVICQKNRGLNPLLGLSPCSPYFIACKNGAVVVAACDKHFLFNEKTQQCETPYETFCSQKLLADAEQICQTVENPPLIDTPLIKASCAEHSVRAFEECADVYYVCHDQTLLRRDCPEGLRFDLAVGACVAHCGDSQYIKELVGSPYDKFCENQGPSKHGLGCTSVYVECSSNGVSSVHECENGFVFNNNIQGCALYCESTPVGLLNKLFEPLIFKSKTNSQSSNVADQNKNPKYLENYRGFNQVTFDTEYRQLDAKTFCSEHDDGAHSIGCSNTFYSCFNGHGVLLHCQDELVFNSKLGACTLSCDQDQPQITVNAMPQKTSLCPLGYIGFLPISQCSEVFIHCKNGVEYKQACPGRHFFNVHLHSCHRSCDAPIGSDTNNVKSDVESIVVDQDVTKKAKPTFLDVRNFRLQPPSTFITDGFSQNPVYIQRIPIPLKTDQFSGVPELSSPVRVPFTPNNVPGRITFDAFDRRGYPYSGRMVYSPFPQFHNVENNNPDLKPLPAVSPPPLLPRPQSYKTINILPPVLPRPSLKKPVSAIMESAEILDLLSKMTLLVPMKVLKFWIF